METKKNSAADINKKSPLFFSFGLLLSISLVIMAFEWKYQDEPGLVIDRFHDPFNDAFDVPATKIPLPPVPVIRNPQIVIADPKEIIEDVKVIISIDPNDLDPDEPEIVVPEAPIEESDEPYLFVEISAAPIGGMKSFYQYLAENIKYPSQASRMNIEGRVFVEFVIQKDGSLSDVRAIKGIGAGCDEEAVRVVQNAPAWNPGKQRGKPVKQRYTLPIIFKLR